MRLFSALAVSEHAADALEGQCGGLPDARWIDRGDFHVTLAFFGEVGRPVAEELAQALSEIVAPPLDLRVERIDVFGSGKPHSLIARVARTPELSALEAKHRAIGEELGLIEAPRKYTPHVTLARIRGVPAIEAAAWLAQRPALGPCEWRADRFALYSSSLSRGGGPYRAEVEFPLRRTT